MLGHIVGLAITDAKNEDVRDCLGQLGIATNRVNGERRGVSFARYQRLVQLIGDVWRDDSNLCGGTSMLMGFLWDKAQSKQDLLAWAKELVGPLSTPVKTKFMCGMIPSPQLLFTALHAVDCA